MVGRRERDKDSEGRGEGGRGRLGFISRRSEGGQREEIPIRISEHVD